MKKLALHFTLMLAFYNNYNKVCLSSHHFDGSGLFLSQCKGTTLVKGHDRNSTEIL